MTMTMKKLLIAEDEQTLAEVLKNRFEEDGWSVAITEDGDETMLALQADTFDLVLLDLLMPKKDGFEVLQEMRKHLVLSKLPVIILTNLEEDENIKKALHLGANDYFIKSQHAIGEILEKVNTFSLAP